ncbi:MAG: alpha-xylosidase [Spirochaetes bacterium]|nr:alpha-xylosidase [Spirochaetota bacterium]
MKQRNRFVFDMLDQDLPEAAGEIIRRAGPPISVDDRGGEAVVRIPFRAQRLEGPFLVPDPTVPDRIIDLRVRAYGDEIMRLSAVFGDRDPADEANPMLELDPGLEQGVLRTRATDEGWELRDGAGRLRLRIVTRDGARCFWSDLQPEPQPSFDTVVFPDGRTAVAFAPDDEFFPKQPESFPLGLVEREGRIDRCLYSLRAAHDEKFAGTGERFTGMNLAGKTLVLENTDALGVNNRRAYKNVPFYVSSRGYGLLVLTSAHVRLSLADISTRAAQGLIEDDLLDLFFIGGGSPERIVRNYRRITGFPRPVPFWSYGTWMSRMSYFSADETREVVRRLREGKFPCDVVHLDSGWFKTSWKCEWEFGRDNFPDPQAFLAQLSERGIRVSLWQLPCVAAGTEHYETAMARGYIPAKRERSALGSNFSAVEFDGTIDFTNPEATAWYQGLLERLLRMGAAVIKTDFGEAIEENAEYRGAPYRLLHNLYPLLYQRAAYEVTRRVRGENETMIWARAGWTGCQRYPIHWGGDCASSWDGFAGSIRGGLHLGMSGFAFWSHDVPGFHGVPSFMNSRPADDLYVRWTQAGIFASHLRYHGSNAHEPYEYPRIADLVRKWLNLRYALIPYLAEAGIEATRTGYPVLRALVFHHADDPTCWGIDDEFYCGPSLLVAPIMNSEGTRDLYLPEGEWIDFWSGEKLTGPRWIKEVTCPLERIPIFAVAGAEIPVYPQPVQHTGEMDLAKVARIRFDSVYSGVSASIIGRVTGL